MSAAYLIAQLKVTNSENYKEYIEKVPEIVKKYGGEYLARGGEYTVVEGEDNYPDNYPRLQQLYIHHLLQGILHHIF